MSRKIFLALYDLILSIGAVYTGVLMIQSNEGVFKDYPKEWVDKIPFHNWVAPGIIIIIIFGLGNMIASLSALYKKSNLLYVLSIIMGGLLLSGIIVQRVILGEWYMPDNYYFVFGVSQLLLSGNGLYKIKKQKLSMGGSIR